MDDPGLQQSRGHSALRKGRVSIPGQPYVVTTVTENRQPIFADFNVGRVVVLAMRELHHAKAVESLAFVVMPDHLHWLFVLGETIGLAEVVRRLKGSSGRALGLRGLACVWQVGYYDHGVRDDRKPASRSTVSGC